ncbi:MAG: hypothetical protein K2X47_20050 [Bdellovibrionales bacterium]|nr:hypothetical protein [Bdellovibrionales bacterium]
MRNYRGFKTVLGVVSTVVCVFIQPTFGAKKLSMPVRDMETEALGQEVADSLAALEGEFDQGAAIKLIKSEQKGRRPSMEGRQPAAVLGDFSQQLWNCKSSEDLAQFLDKLDPTKNSDYKNFPPEIKIFAIHARPLRAFRGFLWKSKNLFERNSAFIQSQAVTKVRKLAASLRIDIPSTHTDAFIDYLAAPYAGAKEFTWESDMQWWLLSELGKEMRESIKELTRLQIGQLEWDNKILQGADSFKDNIRRYSTYGNLEKLASLATFHIVAHDLLIMSAYNPAGSLQVVKEVGKLHGYDGFSNLMQPGFSQVDGVMPFHVAQTVRKISASHGFGKLYTDDNKSPNYSKAISRIKLAYENAYKANEYIQAIWKATEGKTSDENALIQAGFFNIRRAQKQKAVNLLNDLYSLKLEGKKIVERGHPVAMANVIRSGEVLKIDIDKLYLDPPKDLTLFLTTGGKPGVSKVADGKKYRDYMEGNPEKWNWDSYRTYFPSVSKNDDVKVIGRVLGGAGGFWLASSAQ